VIRNKIDLAVEKLCISCESRSGNGSLIAFSISATTGAGTEALLTALSAYARDYFSATESPLVTRARHRRALEETVAALDRALAEGGSAREELIAEELRSAATTLGRLTGRVDVEDILDVIFRDFCIGK
jgi:tRNA modification GTPase